MLQGKRKRQHVWIMTHLISILVLLFSQKSLLLPSYMKLIVQIELNWMSCLKKKKKKKVLGIKPFPFWKMEQDLNKVHALQLADIFSHSLLIYMYSPWSHFFTLRSIFWRNQDTGYWWKGKRPGTKPWQSLEAGTSGFYACPLATPFHLSAGFWAQQIWGPILTCYLLVMRP